MSCDIIYFSSNSKLVVVFFNIITYKKLQYKSLSKIMKKPLALEDKCSIGPQWLTWQALSDSVVRWSDFCPRPLRKIVPPRTPSVYVPLILQCYESVKVLAQGTPSQGTKCWFSESSQWGGNSGGRGRESLEWNPRSEDLNGLQGHKLSLTLLWFVWNKPAGFLHSSHLQRSSIQLLREHLNVRSFLSFWLSGQTCTNIFGVYKILKKSIKS